MPLLSREFQVSTEKALLDLLSGQSFRNEHLFDLFRRVVIAEEAIILLFRDLDLEVSADLGLY